MSVARRRSGTVSVALLRPVVAALGASPPAEFWRATDLAPALLADPEARVTSAQFCVAWAEALRLSGDRALPLAIAASLPTGAFGVVEYVCRTAPTLGDALAQWARYLGLLDDALTMALELEPGGRAALAIAAESDAPAPGAHELCFAMLCRQLRDLATPAPRILAVEFTHPAPAAAVVEAYRRALDAPVRFGAERTQLVLPAAALALPLRTADGTLATILTRAAESALRTLPTDARLAGQVARALHELLRHDRGHIEEVAARLGVPARSLQRRLREEGTSFQDVREDVRRTLADRYLRDGLAISEVAFLVGYSEPSAFFRAFKRWTGSTPIQHVAALRPATA